VVVALLAVLIGRFGGGYTKCMTRVDIPFVLPCLEANCKGAAAEPERNEHWYVVIVAFV